MATEEWIKRAILNGKVYDELPPRVRQLLPLGEWKAKVKEHCIQRGFSWNDSLASTSCAEAEYYEDLLRFYRYNYRLFPYHLADYVCRILRVTPFKYYCDLLYTVMREEKSYDQIPNFAAADIVHIVGIGRNEYIATMNKCKAKKLLWRVNKSIAKEFLPAEPLSIELQPWWQVGVVNLGETEYRQLSPEELRCCQDACRPGGMRVRDCDPRLLQGLHRRGLVYFDVPIRPDDHVSIPPLEGFVSNKDSEREDGKGDPLETLLYAVLVASSARASVAELATILQVDVPRLQRAISVACRLGFAKRLPNRNEGDSESPASAAGGSLASGDTHLGTSLDLDDVAGVVGHGPEAARQQGGPQGMGLSATRLHHAEGDAHSAGDGQAVALVVDAEVTSYLMMGALSPGLKRHSVTLFEGGRVTGPAVISELITELHASVEAAAGFEGEMQNLASYAAALAMALECIRECGDSRPVELLRKESLAGLAPAAACRVLSHAYAAVVPITPLPYPPLPLNPTTPGPTNFGATAEAATPWLHLALYTAMGTGPLSVVLVCGQRIWRLPPQLAGCTHVLIWPWDMDAVRAQSVPILLETTFLLFTLNEYLSRTAIMVQPLQLPPQAELKSLNIVDVALPLSQAASQQELQGISTCTGDAVVLLPQPGISRALQALGLQHALGAVRLLQLDASSAAVHADEMVDVGNVPALRGQEEGGAQEGAVWVPLQLLLGLPLAPQALCANVCRQAKATSFLDPASRKKHEAGQGQLQKQVFMLISDYGACSNCLATPGVKDDDVLSYVDLPIYNLLFDGQEIRRLDYTDFLQGIGTLCIE